MNMGDRWVSEQYMSHDDAKFEQRMEALRVGSSDPRVVADALVELFREVRALKGVHDTVMEHPMMALWKSLP